MPIAVVEKSIVVAAPAEIIFDFIADPNSLSIAWPSMTEVRDVTPNPLGGADFAWTYRMAGMRFDGHTTITEYDRPRRLAGISTFGITSTVTWTLAPEGDATLVTMYGAYTLPARPFGKIAKPFVIQENMKEAEIILTTIKDKLQG
jgi:carbon monoxide dehydrogenase subunit G